MAFDDPVVFVLGAGASCEADMPDGSSLAKIISDKLRVRRNSNRHLESDDSILLDAIKSEFHKDDEIEDVCTRLSKGLNFAMSIDQLIENNNDNPMMQKIGKMAIAQSILDSERLSYLHDSNRLPHQVSRFYKSWYHRIMRLLQVGVPRTEAGSIFNNVTIINFNYDRTLEFVIPHALQDIYGLNKDSAEQIARSLDIFHPYGQVGCLSWQEKEQIIDFGEEVDSSALPKLSESIFTYSEFGRQMPGYWRMNRALSGASRVIFLGFAFHVQNMRLLKNVRQRDTSILATTLGMAEPDESVIKGLIKESFEHMPEARFAGPQGSVTEIITFEGECVDFLDEYWRKISNPTL